MSAADASPESEQVIRARKNRLIDRHDLRQFALYGLNGAFTTVVYTIVVWSMFAFSPHTFVLDVVIAYAVSVICNYVGARRLFQPTTTLKGHIRRYLVVVAGAFTLTSAVAWSLDQAGAPKLIGAYVPVLVTAIPTFIVMRRWVFSSTAVVD